MKREGRQHGMVRAADRTPAGSNRLEPTAGDFACAPSKPTNHSKFTGKCRRPRCPGCHDRPVNKSEAKAKRRHKLRSHDVLSNSRLLAWRVVDGRFGGSNFTGISATGMLDHLHGDCEDDSGDEIEDVYGDYDDYGGVFEGSSGGLGLALNLNMLQSVTPEIRVGDDDDDDESDHRQGGDAVGVMDEEEEEEKMSYCEVGFVVDLEEEEGWCVVEQL